MSIICSRVFSFDAAHRVKNHESKCRNLHGHRFSLELSFTAGNHDLDDLDYVGRVIDFGEIKKIFGDWIDSNFDHNVILFDQDKDLGEAISKITGQKIYYLPYNPTAENIAYYLLHEVCPKLFSLPVKCIKIKLFETPNCSSEVAISNLSHEH